MPLSTTITVRVIANDGKFLGDDIGGAAITIRDFETQEVLASGVTQGDSGPSGVMCASQQRGTPIPMDASTCAFTATLALAAPRRIQVTAFGPLAARASANTVSLTTWLYPGLNLTAGNGLLLELPGLICQVINPPAHTIWPQPVAAQSIVANVAMMCGCPISYKPANSMCTAGGTDEQPWQPTDFQVFAELQPVPGTATRVPLAWDGTTAGRFTAPWPGELPAGTYQVTVVAQQLSTGNTGVDFSTVIVQAASPAQQ